MWAISHTVSETDLDSRIESPFLVVGSFSSHPAEFVLQLLELKILFEGEGQREGEGGRERAARVKN